MVSVHSINCQPIKPSYHLNSKPSFGDIYEDDYYEDDFAGLRQEKREWEDFAKSSDNKMMSTLGALGLGAVSGAIGFGTFKAFAPKGFKTLKSLYIKVSNIGFVKKGAAFVTKYAKKLGHKIANWYTNIKPESSLGKVKKFLDKINPFKKITVKVLKDSNTELSRVLNLTKDSGKITIEINKAGMKNAGLNAGATLAAVPPAVTAVNNGLESNGGGSDD